MENWITEGIVVKVRGSANRRNVVLVLVQSSALATTTRRRYGPPSSADAWVAEQVMSKALREKGHYKAKGVVLKVIDTFVAELRMLDSGVKVRVDQAELETVIPVRSERRQLSHQTVLTNQAFVARGTRFAALLIFDRWGRVGRTWVGRCGC